jgi:hypothetical protein
MNIQIPKTEYLVRFLGDSNRPLVTVGNDGTVTIHEYGAERQAAEIFWNALQVAGMSLVARIAALEDELAPYREYHNE